jgi:hypothetical protein
MNVDVAAVAHQPAQGIALQKTEPARPERFPDDDLCDVVLARDAEQRFSNVTARGRNDLRSELARKRQVASESRLFLLRKRARTFDVCHKPRCLHR